MSETLLAIFGFLMEHADLIDDLISAIKGGVSKDELRRLIRDAKVAASDAAFQEELKLPFKPIE